MAENLQVLKKRIRTAKSIAQLAKAMEMIAASKIKKAQAAVERSRPYAGKITETVEKILASCELKEFVHPYLRPLGSGRKLLIAISPDKGLCGGLPTNLYREMARFDPKTTLVVAIGKKIERFAAAHGYPLAASFHPGSAFPSYASVYPILDIVHKEYESGASGEVHVLSTSFSSMIAQTAATVRLLPLALQPGCAAHDGHYIFEPGVEPVLRELLPYYIEVKLYNALVQAYTAEQAARMVAMKNAKENALEITDYLTLSYNRTRQEKITGEILDLANGQIA
jgi:F-type H+-transporting ATPase subunit gamma